MSENKAKGFDLKTLIFMGTGSVIGAGVVTYVGIAVGYTGRATWLAYLVAIVMGFLTNLPLILMTTAARIKGGNYSFMATTLGDLWGGYYGIASILTVLAFSNFALALGAYLNIAIPAIPAKVWAYAGITTFMIINLFGTNFMAKIENVLSVILIFGLLLLGFYGIANALPGSMDISQSGYFLKGADGFFQAIMVLMASTTGYALITAFSGQCQNPKKDLPLALCIVPLILMVIYGSVGFAMSNVLPVEQTANQTLVVVAKEFFSPTLTTVFIFAGPVMALATTLNSSFGIFERPLLVITKDGWLPTSLATQNKHGVAWKYMLIIYCIGIIPMTLGLNIATILGNITFVMSLNNILLIIGIMKYPKTMEGAWENRAWKYPMWLFKAACFIALAIQCFLIWRSFKSANMGMIIGSVITLIVIMVWCIYRQKSGKVHVTKSWELQ